MKTTKINIYVEKENGNKYLLELSPSLFGYIREWINKLVPRSCWKKL